MHIRHGLTAATLGIVGSLLAFAGCKSSPGTNARDVDGGDSQNVADGAQHPPSCNLVCATAQDCGGGGGLDDSSHFQCTAGRCHWQGCKSKADCTTNLQSDNFVCVKEGGATVPTCVPTCTGPADCAGQTPSDDASHYQCNGGRCQWQGCKSDAECNAAFQSTKFVCVKEGGAPVPGCVLACNSPTDCAPPGGEGPDASRFTCTNHRCAWLGCASTAECKTLYHVDKVVCE
jgi:hypothetical protein